MAMINILVCILPFQWVIVIYHSFDMLLIISKLRFLEFVVYSLFFAFIENSNECQDNFNIAFTISCTHGIHISTMLTVMHLVFSLKLMHLSLLGN